MACGLRNRRSCPAAMRTDVTGAKPHFVFNRLRRRIWKRCLKPDAPSRLPSATNLFSPPDLWANTPLGTAASLTAACARSVVNSSARPAVTGIIQIHFVPTASLPLRGIPVTCRAELLPTSSKTSAFHATTSISKGFEPCRRACRAVA